MYVVKHILLYGLFAIFDSEAKMLMCVVYYIVYTLMSITDNPPANLPRRRRYMYRNDAYTGNLNSVDISYNFNLLSAYDPDLNILKQQNYVLFQSKYYTVEEFNIETWLNSKTARLYNLNTMNTNMK